MLGGTGGRCYVKGHVRLVRVSHLESIFLRDFLFDFVPTVEKANLCCWSGNTDTVWLAYLGSRSRWWWVAREEEDEADKSYDGQRR